MKKLQDIQKQYDMNYQDIPRDDEDRLRHLMSKSNISLEDVMDINDRMRLQIKYDTYKIILYEKPVGKPRPRFKRFGGKNHIYSGNEYYRKKVFKNVLAKEELENLKHHLIATPCIIHYNIYLKTPNSFNKLDTILAEIGTIRPLNKPDWDNLGKEYSDLFNQLIWIDDIVVISASVDKYYSILPRVEIVFHPANALYNKYQFNSMKKKLPDRTFKYFKKGQLMEG